MSEATMKRCIECDEWKEKGEFKPGRNQCKECKKRLDRERRRERRQQNPEETRAYDRQWYQEHAEEQQERARKYRQGHKSQRYDYHLRYYQRNKEYLIRYWHEYRRGKWEKCMTLTGEVCQKCGQKKMWQVMSFHHVDPKLKTKNGTKAVYENDLTELDKCALLCVECHFLYEAQVWQGVWRKRDGLGYELTEWWYTFRYSGDYYETLKDNRFNPTLFNRT